MEQANIETPPDLLTRLLRNRTMRTLIAIAIFVRVMDVYYDAGYSLIKGYKEAERKHAAVSSAPAHARK